VLTAQAHLVGLTTAYALFTIVDSL